MQEPWEGERKIGQKAFWSALGIPFHQAHPYRRDSILTSLRDIGHHPVDIYMSTLCTEEIDWDQNDAQLRLAQDQSEER